jgi:Tfp pilus assembly protein FimT
LELIVMVGVMVIIIVIAGSMSARFAQRRSVDNMTRNLSSTLQLAKLNAVRQGVEYRAVLASCSQLDNADPDCPVCDAYDDYAPGDDTVTITIERGDSNRGSTNWCVISMQTRRVQQGMALDLTDIPETAPRRFNFNPNGTLVDQTGAILAQQIDIGVKPAAGTKIRRCGRITVTPLGRIGIVEGNWDQGASECKPITK